MPRYLIELPHETEVVACARAVRVLLESGSHFLTHADFGCHDGDHRAWITVDVDSREEARCIVPPVYRSRARVIALNRFSLEELADLVRLHTPTPAANANSPADVAVEPRGLRLHTGPASAGRGQMPASTVHNPKREESHR